MFWKSFPNLKIHIGPPVSIILSSIGTFLSLFCNSHPNSNKIFHYFFSFCFHFHLGPDKNKTSMCIVVLGLIMRFTEHLGSVPGNYQVYQRGHCVKFM